MCYYPLFMKSYLLTHLSYFMDTSTYKNHEMCNVITYRCTYYYSYRNCTNNCTSCIIIIIIIVVIVVLLLCDHYTRFIGCDDSH